MDLPNVLLNQPIVIDNGSGLIKAGFAGQQQPKSYFPACVGRPKHSRIMAGAVQGDTFVGPETQSLRGLLKLNYPMRHGVVKDWDDMERIWSYIYSAQMPSNTRQQQQSSSSASSSSRIGVSATTGESTNGGSLSAQPEEHPVLLTEAPLNPSTNREIAAQILFETFNVPALYVSMQAVLSLYASGKTTGVVIDAGDGVTHSVPVYEGFAINNAIKRIDVAGRDVTEHLQLLLRKSAAGVVLSSSSELEIVRRIKESCCYIAKDPRMEEREWADSHLKALRSIGFGSGMLSMGYGPTAASRSIRNISGTGAGAAASALVNLQGPRNTRIVSSSSSTGGGQGDSTSLSSQVPQQEQQPKQNQPDEFRLPDGRIIRLGPERFRAPEILFDPESIGLECQGVHQMVNDSITLADIDIRATLYSNLVLSGGSTMTRGFGDRLLNELRILAPTKDTKIRIYAPPERKYSTWIGGSILASLSTFRKMWVSADEWHENPDIIHTKCI